MKSLEKWQLISFISRGVAMAFGIIQSFVILRILSVADWGIVQLAVSVGASLGIYQHLGLASASNREIAASKKETDVFKVFVTSVTVRYCVTIPLAVGLFVFAPKIAKVYGFSEILLPLRIYAIVIFFQGAQAILNAVVAGTKRFKELFIYQMVIALVSVFIYIPMVYFYGILGFFYALLMHEVIKTSVMLVIALKPYYKNLRLPTKQEYKKTFKSLFSLGMSIYVVKILIINWEKSGTNLLGFTQNADLLGIYAFALLYAKKLMHVSDAATDVNLPVFSEKYVKDIKGFKNLFAQNFNRIYTLIVFFAMSAIYWAYEIINLLVGSGKYDASIKYLVPMVFTFIFFSLINILKSSVAIPAKLVKEMIIGFVVLFVATMAVYFLGRGLTADPLFSMSYAMLLGAGLSFGYLVFLLQKKLAFKFFTHAHTLILVQALFVSVSGNLANLALKFIAYLLFVAFYIGGVYLAGFVTKKDFAFVTNKLLRRK